jgi:hypothetical protein
MEGCESVLVGFKINPWLKSVLILRYVNFLNNFGAYILMVLKAWLVKESVPVFIDHVHYIDIRELFEYWEQLIQVTTFDLDYGLLSGLPDSQVINIGSLEFSDASTLPLIPLEFHVILCCHHLQFRVYLILLFSLGI